MDKTIIDTSSGTIKPKSGNNPRTPYEHQIKAMQNMDIINKSDKFSTLVVLPTGGGKTYTASMWLLKNAIDKKKKILWLAHRKMLLDQAAESFQKYAFPELIPHISSFKYRIISGDASHGRTSEIQADDNLLIVSKDSLGRNLSRLDAWLKGEDEIFLVVDEAHHSTAKTYRKVIDYVKDKVSNIKIIGLTATPFRTSEDEKGLLAKIYSDGVESGMAVHGDIGITYRIDLKELIKRQILSRPIFKSYYTEEMYGENIGLDALESIQHLDRLPEEIEQQIVDSAARNRLIVDTYVKGKEEYGKTLVFAVNKVHAISLQGLFEKAGIESEFIISDTRDMATGVTVSREENNRKIKAYQDGNVDVLINVNILTEGVDLPQTKTVFLARPTVSTILMTQMIGRALRGSKAGGTDSAYIVSFIDNWNEHISWVNPETIFDGGTNEFSDNDRERTASEIRIIAISKIGEFASILDDTVDTENLEKLPFSERIPVGMYTFTYLEEDGADVSHQVLVYNSTKEAFEEMMKALPVLFKDFEVDDEFLDKDTLKKMASQCRDSFFLGDMIPPYEERDVVEILKYYAQKDATPAFKSFEDIDKSRLDVAAIAKHIHDKDMRRSEEKEYVDSLWDNEDDDLLRLFFGRKLYFLRQLEIEMIKLEGGYDDQDDNVEHGTRKLEDLPLYEIGKYNPEYEKKLRDDAFEASKDSNGLFTCACCGKKDTTKVPFQVDHIKPMNAGGKSIPENLQILCRRCNGTKGDS